MRSRYLYLSLSLMALLLSACGKMNLSINKHDLLIPQILNPFSAPTAAEIVSGSVVDVVTTNNYHVNVTVGTMIKSVNDVSTPNGYKISYGLDGEFQ